MLTLRLHVKRSILGAKRNYLRSFKTRLGKSRWDFVLKPWEDTKLEIFIDETCGPLHTPTERFLTQIGAAQALVTFPLGFVMNGLFFRTPIISQFDLFVRCFIITWISVGWTFLMYWGFSSWLQLAVFREQNHQIADYSRTNRVRQVEVNTQTQIVTVNTFSHKSFEFQVGELTLSSYPNNALFLTGGPLDFPLSTHLTVSNNLFYHIFCLNPNPKIIFEGKHQLDWFKIGTTNNFQEDRNFVNVEYKGLELSLIVLKNPQASSNKDLFLAANRYVNFAGEPEDRSTFELYNTIEESLPLRVVDGDIFVQLGAAFYVRGFFSQQTDQIQKA